MAFLVWLDAAFDYATAERDHNAIRPRTDEKMTSEVHPYWDADFVCKNIEGLYHFRAAKKDCSVGVLLQTTVPVVPCL